jgi:hypothetical protein
MILIVDTTNGEIVGADKDFLKSFSIEELNQKFSNLEEIKNNYKAYSIEEIPIKNYKLLFFKKDESLKENESLDFGLINEPLEENAILDDNLLNIDEFNTQNDDKNDKIEIDNLLNNSLLTPTNTNEDENNKNSFDNLLNIDEPNSQTNDIKKENDKIDIDNLLNDSLINEKEEPKIEKSNILLNIDETKNSNENTNNINNSDTEKIDNFSDNSINNETSKNQNENLINIENITNETIEKTMSKKSVIEINFDIKSILKKKQKNKIKE